MSSPTTLEEDEASKAGAGEDAVEASSTSSTNGEETETPNRSKHEHVPDDNDKTTEIDEINELGKELGRLAVSKKESEEEEKEPYDPGLIRLASWIKDGIVSNILVVSGAGISVAAGIPDFRTPGTGLYDNLQAYNLPYPEAIFDISYYRHSPQAFCRFAKELWPGIKFRPTLTHCFLTLLARHECLLRVYTQNIDGLERLAQLPHEQLVECHGHFSSASCIQCYKTADIDEVKQTMLQFEDDDNGSNEELHLHDKKKVPGVPSCASCGGYVKPDIVFFGENLPKRFYSSIQHDKKKADCCLILGTSLQVEPVSSIPSWVRGPRFLLNRERVDSCLRMKDYFCPGDCDSSILILSELLGWKEELLDLHAQFHDV